MTGEDHTTDALIAALRSPALPAEQVGEEAALTAMLEVLGTALAKSGWRARRGVAIAVVTVASLGVGGLAAAGPGVFTAAADRARSLVTSDSEQESDDGSVVPGDDSSTDDSSTESAEAAPPSSLDATSTDAQGTSDASPTVDPLAEIECAEGNHGATVSEAAHATLPPDATNRGEIVSRAARSDCGKDNADEGAEPSDTTTPTSVECAEGNHGATVSEAAHATLPPDATNRGEIVSQAARSDCGKQNADEGEETDTTVAGQPGNQGNGNRNGNGNGNSQGDDADATTETETEPAPQNPPGNANAGNANAGNANAGNAMPATRTPATKEQERRGRLASRA